VTARRYQLQRAGTGGVESALRRSDMRRALPCICVVLATVALLSGGAARAQDASFGQRLYHDKADCQFCHGVNGDGRGDPRSPGKAADLRKTFLTRDQLIEVIACGRRGTEMPHFDKFAYEDKGCRGYSAADPGKGMPPFPHSTSLTRREIEAVADYILATFVGK
jgi:mono/diheme cytochrome c family protein